MKRVWVRMMVDGGSSDYGMVVGKAMVIVME
jgi:hypothetical protein